MGIMTALKEELKEASILFRRVNSHRGENILGFNFRKFGADFGVYDFDEFVEKARGFYREAANSGDPGFSVVDLPDGRKAIDKDGEMRGIFNEEGEPIAFFRPDFRELGYDDKEQELADFRAGKYYTVA